MHRFFNSIIRPALSILQPKIIVEIGSDRGHCTGKVLQFCEESQAVLHVIDPLPKFPVSEWQRRHGDRVVFHQDYSLNVIHQLEGIDLVLIDGDHNWYTVFYELTALRKNAERLSIPFPLTFLHDVGWPYGRRDLYYNPDNVPERYRKPYRKAGILPGKTELVEQGGLNQHLDNAIHENDLESGVATAMEDFVARSDGALEAATLAGLFGLGIVYPKELLERAPELAALIAALDLPPPVATHLEQVEADRLQSLIKIQQRDAVAHRLADKHRREVAKQEEDRQGLVDTLASRDEQLEASRSRVEDLEAALERERRATDDLRADLERSQRALADAQVQAAALKESLSELQGQQRELRRRFDEKHNSINIRERDRTLLTGWLDQLAAQLGRLERSGGYRAGRLLDRLGQAVFAQSTLTEATGRIQEVLAAFERWKRRPPSGPRGKAGQAAPGGTGPTPAGARVVVPETRRLAPARERPQAIVRPPDGEALDVIVCVHNALEDVQRCIASVQANTLLPFRLIVVDDASDAPTASYLDGLEGVTVIRNEENLGYTRSVNVGIRASRSSVFVLLNSDTVVHHGWLGRLYRVFAGHPSAGIVSPLSNAASYQSVPRVFEPGTKEWAIDPPPFDTQRWAELIAEMASARQPHLPNLNGFCLAIRRSVIESIGLFDEEKYPFGYGEENDFCLRSQDAGYSTLVADDCYVYHAKSKSFSHERRRKLAEAGHQAYTRTYGTSRLQANTYFLQNLNPLDALRHRLQRLPGRPYSICYILPVTAISGGVISVFQTVSHLNLLGVDASVIVPASTREEAKGLFDLGDKLLAFERTTDIPRLCGRFDILVATHNSSVEYVCDTRRVAGRPILAGYFVQDYEPWFYKPQSEAWRRARDSYELTSDQVLVAKTNYLVDTVRAHHPDVRIHQIRPGFDVSTYRPDPNHLADHRPLRVCAMVRPVSPRRAPGETLRVLARLLHHAPQEVEIHVFGCDEREIKRLKVDRSFHHHGVLPQRDLLGLLCDCDVFLDMSPYQAFGRTGLEAMAAGCLAVLPRGSGPDEYAVHDRNAVLLDMKDEGGVFDALRGLMAGPARRMRLKQAALDTAAEYNCMGDALMQWEIFSAAYRVRYDPPRVNVIIPVRDKADLTRTCLDSLLGLTSYPAFQVTVIDNASRPKTAALLRKLEREHERLQVLTNRENRSYSAANNQGAAAGDTELLLFLNNDTEINDPDWLTLLVDELLQRPMAAAVGPRLLYPNRKVQSAGIRVDIDPETRSFVRSSEIREPRPSRYVEGLTAACILMRAAPFEELGGFDERFFYGQEDVDLCLGLRARGFDLYHCAEVTVIHNESSTRKFDEITVRNRERIRAKWLGKAANLGPVEDGAGEG